MSAGASAQYFNDEGNFSSNRERLASPTAHSQTPIRSAPKKTAVLQPLINSDSSNGSSNDTRPSNKSEPRKSFLYLNNDSSPSSAGDTSLTYSTRSHSDSPSARTAANKTNTVTPPSGLSRGNGSTLQGTKPRYDAESSFFAMTSPLASRNTSADRSSRYRDDNEVPDEMNQPTSTDSISRKSSRGTRLGAQMGRTSSAQSAQLSNSVIPPDSLADTSIDSMLSRRPTPTKRAHGARIENAIEKLMLTSQKMGFDSSPTIHHTTRAETSKLRSRFQDNNQPDTDDIHTTERKVISSPDSERLARLNAELQAVRQPSVAPQKPQIDISEQEGMQSSSKDTSPIGVAFAIQGKGGQRVGRLSRLQYNKGDGMSTSSRPAWDTSETKAPNKIFPVTRNAPRLRNQASNPSLLSEFKREDQSPPADMDDSHRSSSVNENRDYQAGGLSAIPSSPQNGERRNLILPRLSDYRTAVENAVTSPTESFIRGVRRRSSAGLLQQKFAKEETNNEIEGQLQIQGQLEKTEEPTRSDQSQTYKNEAADADNMADTLSKDLSKSQQQTSVPKVNIFSSSSSPQAPTSSSRATDRSSYRKPAPNRSTRAGKLTDLEIAQLGATAGVNPITLLNSNGQALSSKNILTIALQKAQSAVLLDGENSVKEAIEAYKQAVRLLEEVMDRVSPSSSSSSRRKSSREEERRRLKVIHDTYADRIRLLSIICAPEEDPLSEISLDDAIDSFARDSPSPIHRSSLIEVKADRNSTALQYELRDERSEVVVSVIEKKEDLSDGQRSAAAAKETSRERCNSDHSFQSAVEINGRHLETSANLQAPINQGNLKSRIVEGKDEEARVPATPYFDADQGTIGNVNRSPPLGAKSSVPEKRSPLSSEILLYPERRKSRSPVDRLARGMSSLGNVPSAREIATMDRASLQHKSRRYLSVGSQALLEKEFPSRRSSSSSRRDAKSSRADTPPFEEMDPSTPAGKSPLTSATIRPRTRVSKISTVEMNRPLVNTDVNSGTINQRRRLAADDGLLAGGSGDEGRTIDANEYSSKPYSPPRKMIDRETLRDRRLMSKTSPISGPTLSDEEVENRIHSQRFSLGRKRASSQPGNRRPSIPTNFFLNHPLPSASPQGPLPPVPQIRRKASMPLSPLATGVSSGQSGTLKSPLSATLGSNFLNLRFPSPAPSMTSGYHALGTPLTPLQQSWPGMSLSVGAYNSEGKNGIISDIFGNSLPSMQVGAVPSFTSNSYPTPLPWIGITNNQPDMKMVPSNPRLRSLRPFYTMKQLLISIEKGAYISKRLFVPRDLWMQSGSRLLAIETKIRMVESICSAIDGIEQSGRFLLHPMQFDQPGLTAIDASRFLKILEEFDLLLVEVQNTLAKKLGFLETVRGKKGSSLGVFGTKLTRSLDRMTHHSRSMDSTAVYVDGLYRLFARAQVLGNHLNTLERSKNDRGTSSPIRGGDHDGESYNTDNYATLPSELKRNIELKLVRFSDFFANVVLRFVLRDVAILMDKSVKRHTILLTE